MQRRLSPEERTLWAQVAASVRPFAGRRSPAADALASLPEVARADLVQGRAGRPAPLSPRRPGPGETLDASWDRRLSRGLVQPDRTVDLHGHTLVTAHAALDFALAAAVGEGARLLLVITGKPPAAAEGSLGAPRRGLIRAAIGDWLALSSHAGSIAAIRGAHPRHGGAGALYVVLRRRR